MFEIVVTELYERLSSELVEGNSGFNGTIGREMNSEIIIKVLIKKTTMIIIRLAGDV